MKYKLNILVFLSFLSLCSFANNNQLFEKANDLYGKGMYENAINTYSQIINSGYVSSDLYYNIGNAYFKNNEIAKAILNYEKALKIEPNNSDIIHNIRVANGKIVDKVDTLPELFYSKWWRSLTLIFATNTWAWLAIISLALFLLMFISFLLAKTIAKRKIFFFTSLVIILLHLVILSVSFNVYSNLKKHNFAIIMNANVTVKSSPDEQSIDLFVVHEGLKVKVDDKVGKWRQIVLTNGSKGWIEEDTINFI